MDADVRIDPDGTTWIRIDSNGKAYWYRQDLLKEAWGPASEIPFRIKFDPPPMPTFYSYAPAVRVRWNIPFTTGAM